MENEQVNRVPEYEVEALARCLLPAIREFFDSEDGQRQFKEWEQGQHNKT